MKAALRRLFNASFAIALLTGGLPGAAQTGTWNINVDSSWVNPGNWTGGTLPGNNNTGVANFVGGNNTVNQDSGGPWTLNFLGTNSVYTFNGGEIIFGGTNPTLFVANGNVFNNPVSYNQLLTVNAPSVGNGATIAGTMPTSSAGITKIGSGFLTINATNLVLGPLTIQAGTVTTSQTSVEPTRTLTMVAPSLLNTGPAYWHTLNGGGNINLLAGTTEFGGGGNFTGNIGGPGELFASGGSLTLLGNNAFTGGVRLAAGNLTIGDGVAGIFPNGPITFNAGNGTLTLNPTLPASITAISAPFGTAPTMTINGGTFNVTGPWSFNDTGIITINTATVTSNNGITAGSLTVNTGGSLTAPLITTRALAGGGTITNGLMMTVNNLSNTLFSGNITGAGQLIKDGTAVLTLSGANTYTGNTAIGGGTLLVNGSITSNVAVGSGTTLGGNGTINGTVSVGLGATLSPGVSPGILNTGNLTMSNASTLEVEIAGPVAGTGYDQVRVTGTVNLTTPNLIFSGAYVPVAGDQFIIVDNDGADPVSGTFLGYPEGATFNFNGRQVRLTYLGGTGNDVALVALTFAVTPSASAGGSITPNTVQNVLANAQPTFTITPNVGFTVQPVTGTCGGNLAGSTYTTNPVIGNCTVIANFLINTYTVTSTGGGANGTITPPSVGVTHGSTTTFTVTPSPTYSASASGCGGSLVGTTFTTGPITGPCTVTASFSQVTFTVTPSAGPNGTITPNTPQTVAQNATTTFTVTPSAGFSAVVGGTCGGTLVGNTYTTNAILGNCTVAAVFDPVPVTSFTGPTATGTGNATVSITGGGAACGFAPQGTGPAQSAFFIPVEGHAKSPPAGTAPPNFAFTHGLLDFVLINCTPGSTVTFSVIYPIALPAGTPYWKYGPEPGNAAPHWYILPATITGTTATFTITDGAQGDDDLAANGTIVDQGGPGVPSGGAGAQPTPTLSEWALIALAVLMLAFGMSSTRRKRACR